jgi:GNAT superfamily N-acetyltransferase
VVPTTANHAVSVVPLTPAHIDACERIARSLPKWFGIEEGLRELRHCLETEAGWVALADEESIGFLTVSAPFPETREITWMAVAPAWHRQGIGRRLVDHVIETSRSAGATLLHVKTLADTHPSPEYAQTRAFYTALGFQRLVILPDLWDPANPCLLQVLPL